ncbi:MAG: hypothetical protein HGA80_06740 [Candidatus Omnitrophica bacterium]|nr:hypothetical protein [Candidatus Omnitrophota bacterium]
MKKTLLVLTCLVMFFALNARAQFMKDKYEAEVGVVDAIAAKSARLYANEEIPGAVEDRKPQAQRYNEMVVHIDNAIVHHYNTTLITGEKI